MSNPTSVGPVGVTGVVLVLAKLLVMTDTPKLHLTIGKVDISIIKIKINVCICSFNLIGDLVITKLTRIGLVGNDSFPTKPISVSSKLRTKACIQSLA
jgi:hypothetical protein